jgi:hypothetical protein
LSALKSVQVTCEGTDISALAGPLRISPDVLDDRLGQSDA